VQGRHRRRDGPASGVLLYVAKCGDCARFRRGRVGMAHGRTPGSTGLHFETLAPDRGLLTRAPVLGFPGPVGSGSTGAAAPQLSSSGGAAPAQAEATWISASKAGATSTPFPGETRGDIRFVSRGAAPPNADPLPVEDDQTAREIAAWIAGNPAARAQIGEQMSRQPSFGGAAGTAVDSVSAWLLAEQLRIYVRRPTVNEPIAPKRPERPPERPQPSSAPSRRAQVATHWIDIELVGEDGVGISGARYSIVTSAGVTLTGTTDEHGSARVDGISPGTCRVSFPDYDESAFKRPAPSSASGPSAAGAAAKAPQSSSAASTSAPTAASQ